MYVAGWNSDHVVIYAPVTSSQPPARTVTSTSLSQIDGVADEGTTATLDSGATTDSYVP